MDMWDKLVTGALAFLSSGSVTALGAFLRKLSTALAVLKTRLDGMEQRIVSLEDRGRNPAPSIDSAILNELRRDVGKLEDDVSELEAKFTEVWRNLVPRDELTTKLDKLIGHVGIIKGKMESLSGRL